MKYDETKTAVNVRRFLSTDFQRMRQKAQLANVLPAVITYDGLPGGDGYENTVETHLSIYVDASKFVDTVMKVLAVISDDKTQHRKILTLRFVDDISDEFVMSRIDMPRTTYFHNKKQALLEFADVFAPIIDFRVIE